MRIRLSAVTGIFMLALSAVPAAQAYDFTSGSVFYDFTSPRRTSVYVTYASLQDNLEAYQDEVVIPAKAKWQLSELPVLGIGDHALFNCQFVSSVVIEDGPTYIMEQAFSHCYGMKSLRLPQTLTYIDDYAFEYCEDLTTVTIPASVEEFGMAVFSYCAGLKEIKVEEGNPILEDDNGILYLKGKKVLVQYPSGRPDTEFTVPAGVTTVTDYAFCPAANLVRVTIGPDVEQIRALTFADCTALEAIEVDEANPNNESVDGVLFNKDITRLIQYPRMCPGDDYVFPATVRTIADMAFSGCRAVNVTLPESLESIGEYAFYATMLQTITCLAPVPPSVGMMAFSDYNATVYVPEQYVDDYRKAAGWKNFKDIRAIETDGVGDIEADGSINLDGTMLSCGAGQGVEVFDLAGRRVACGTGSVELPSKGVYVVMTGGRRFKVTVK